MSHTGTPCSGTQFARNDALADAASAARIRGEFSGWLRRYLTLDQEKSGDVLLAVNEAMANVAEFAYFGRPGPMHVCADYDGRAATLTVTVTDEGVWRDADPATKGRSRGRGIPLMQMLADRATVVTSPAGTRVCLEWNRVTT
jgi:anti-sigma regulatory factor (Ser/Thr protein kinase)